MFIELNGFLNFLSAPLVLRPSLPTHPTLIPSPFPSLTSNHGTGPMAHTKCTGKNGETRKFRSRSGVQREQSVSMDSIGQPDLPRVELWDVLLLVCRLIVSLTDQVALVFTQRRNLSI